MSAARFRAYSPNQNRSGSAPLGNCMRGIRAPIVCKSSRGKTAAQQRIFGDSQGGICKRNKCIDAEI